MAEPSDQSRYKIQRCNSYNLEAIITKQKKKAMDSDHLPTPYQTLPSLTLPELAAGPRKICSNEWSFLEQTIYSPENWTVPEQQTRTTTNLSNRTRNIETKQLSSGSQHYQKKKVPQTQKWSLPGLPDSTHHGYLSGGHLRHFKQCYTECSCRGKHTNFTGLELH